MLQGDEIAEWKYTEPFTIKSSSGRFCGKYKIKYKENGYFGSKHFGLGYSGWSFQLITPNDPKDIILIPIVERCKNLKQADILAQKKIRKLVYYTLQCDYLVSKIIEEYDEDLKGIYEYTVTSKKKLVTIKVTITGDPNLSNIKDIEVISTNPDVKKGTWQWGYINHFLSGKFKDNIDFGSFGTKEELRQIHVDNTQAAILAWMKKIYDVYYPSRDRKIEKEYNKSFWSEANQYKPAGKKYYSVPVIKPKYNAKRLKR